MQQERDREKAPQSPVPSIPEHAIAAEGIQACGLVAVSPVCGLLCDHGVACVIESSLFEILKKIVVFAGKGIGAFWGILRLCNFVDAENLLGGGL